MTNVIQRVDADGLPYIVQRIEPPIGELEDRFRLGVFWPRVIPLKFHLFDGSSYEVEVYSELLCDLISGDESLPGPDLIEFLESLWPSLRGSGEQLNLFPCDTNEYEGMKYVALGQNYELFEDVNANGEQRGS